MNALVQELAQKIWVENLQARLPYYTVVVAIVLLTHSLAQLTWSLVPQSVDQPKASTAQRHSPRATRVAREQPLAQKIGNLNLFGKYEPVKVEQEPVRPKVVPETKLNLKLRGVFASQNEEASHAIIADARGDEDSYRIGSEVPGGAILKEIHSDHVIILHNGRLETLKLPEEEGQGEVGGRGPGAARPSISTVSSRMAESRANHSAASRNIGGASHAGSGAVANTRSVENLSRDVADNAELLGQYRSALLNNPNSVMGLVNVSPYQKDGQLMGYRIRPGRDRALLQRFGLRSGDVVTSVNGVPMNNPVKALEVLRDLSSASSLTVEVNRNGSPQTFTFQIQ